MKALVLSGGGVAGISWMLGIVEGLAAIDRARAEEPTEAAALVRIANMEPLGPHISEADGGR